MYCPYVQDEIAEPAYEVVYSFTGQALADEYNRNFTFHVVFRPEELPQALRTALSRGKVSRAELATYFAVTTSRPLVRASVIDEQSSSFCDRDYLDGNWMQKDPGCRDKVNLKTVTIPSANITVRVKPASPHTQPTTVAAR